MIRESREFAARAQAFAFQRIAAAITLPSERSLIVFNPLTQPRTDIVRVEPGKLTPADRIVDPVSRQEVPWQTMPDGSALFVAGNVPSLGYKTFAVRRGESQGEATSAASRHDAGKPLLPRGVRSGDRYDYQHPG